MSRGSPRLPGYLAHILQAIRRIYRYTADMGAVEFPGNEQIQDAVIRATLRSSGRHVEISSAVTLILPRIIRSYL